MANPYFLTWQEVLDQLLSFLPPSWRANLSGKVLKRLLVAFALSVEALYALLARLLRLSIAQTSEGEWLRAIARGFSLEPFEGTAAVVAVRFERYGDPVGTVTIPAGTEVGATFGQVYRTGIAAVIPDGAQFVDVPCTCTQVGTSGNISAGEISGLVTPVAGVDAVSNPNPGVLGRDAEADQEIKLRIPKHLESLHRATIPATTNAIALDRQNFPDVLDFVTQRNYGTPGYFRAVLSDATGGDLYRLRDWNAAGNGVYFVPTSLTQIDGLVSAGWPCKRFGVPGRNASGEEVWAASPFVANVEQGNWRFCHDKGAGRLYARADGRDLNTLDLTVYAGVIWRALRYLELEYGAIGVGIDVIAPFVVRAEVGLSYVLEPTYQQFDVENRLRRAVSDFVAAQRLGQQFELEGLYSALALVQGAGGVLVTTPLDNIAVPNDSVFRLLNLPQIVRRAA